MVGLAVCEALARTASQFPSAEAPLPEGLWGDGTSMALSLAESLIENKGVDQRDQMIRYTSWFRYGYLSSSETCEYIDEAVKQATLRFERNWDPEDRADVQGDVCLSRVAPVAIFFADSPHAVQDACTQSTRTTHSGPQSLDACRLLAAMVHIALTSEDKARVTFPELPASLCPEIAALCTDAPHCGEYAAGVALQAAVNAFRATSSFAEGAQACLPCGPRALAAYGQLAGAWYGLTAIPAPWRDSLVRFEVLERLTDALLRG
jgi:ADP-ribosyl-[dinitrogen reductase] hydrolase